MIGKIFITSSGYDPELGKHVKDPYLGDHPSLGACRPDIRRKVVRGDHIFVISGRVANADQFVMGGFEVETKIHASEAYVLFPEQRLHLRGDGQIGGNIIVNARGAQHRLDTHSSFDERIRNYVVGKEAVALVTPEEIARGRVETLGVLCDVLGKKGLSPKEVVGRWGTELTESQVIEILAWLHLVKQAAARGRSRGSHGR